ncbi:hypothetical protein A2933_00110, partial [Candidatus Nomurabacteria bacterium RIFCSPLOWO2_01_FULL_46_18]
KLIELFIMMMHNKAWGHGCNTSKVIRVLLIIGGVNWGLVGLGMFLGSDLNVVNMILGSMPTVEAIVYILVGIAAVMKIFGCGCKSCTACLVDGKMMGGGTQGGMGGGGAM